MSFRPSLAPINFLKARKNRVTCSFSHRMRYTRSHLPIREVVEAAKVVQPEIATLPDILVIDRSFATFNSSQTSVLEVFHKDYHDPEDLAGRMTPRDFVRAPKKRAIWALPSTRRSWIIEEDHETESSDVGHGQLQRNPIDSEHLTMENQSLDQVDETDSEDQAVYTAEESVRTEGEPELSDEDGDSNTETTTVHSLEDGKGGILSSTVDWQRIRRSSVQWQRKRSNTADTMTTTTTSRSDDAPPGFLAFIKSGMSPPTSIPSDEDSPNSGSDESEGRVCQAFVLKLLPALDLPETTFKFDEYDWFKRNPSRRSSLQLNRLPSEADGNPKTCGDMCSSVWI